MHPNMLPEKMCTLHLNVREHRKAYYRGYSPSHTWHYLCEGCYLMFGHKYDDVSELGTNGVTQLALKYTV